MEIIEADFKRMDHENDISITDDEELPNSLESLRKEMAQEWEKLKEVEADVIKKSSYEVGVFNLTPADDVEKAKIELKKESNK